MWPKDKLDKLFSLNSSSNEVDSFHKEMVAHSLST